MKIRSNSEFDPTQAARSGVRCRKRRAPAARTSTRRSARTRTPAPARRTPPRGESTSVGCHGMHRSQERAFKRIFSDVRLSWDVIDLGESLQTHIFLQKLASIQPRTSPVKFARLLNPGRPGNFEMRPRCGQAGQQGLPSRPRGATRSGLYRPRKRCRRRASLHVNRINRVQDRQRPLMAVSRSLNEGFSFFFIMFFM